MPKYLTIHKEEYIDRILLESRWTELSKDPRAEWIMTLYNTELGLRYCEWDAPTPQAIEEIFQDLGIQWSEILEVEITRPSDWRRWETGSSRRMPNCWEVTCCGREPGGRKAAGGNTCPVAEDTRFSGINRGIGAGRYCWKVAGTYCGDQVPEMLGRKMIDCALCGFFQQVKREEGDKFQF